MIYFLIIDSKYSFLLFKDFFKKKVSLCISNIFPNSVWIVFNKEKLFQQFRRTINCMKLIIKFLDLNFVISNFFFLCLTLILYIYFYFNFTWAIILLLNWSLRSTIWPWSNFFMLGSSTSVKSIKFTSNNSSEFIKCWSLLNNCSLNVYSSFK